MKDAPSPGAYVAGGLALASAAALAYWQHYNNNVAAPPRLWLADGPLRERVLPHCSALLRPFSPTPWAANRHAQTVLGFMRTLTMRNRYNRQLILTVDGATLALDWFDGCDSPASPAPADAPVLLVCHGINGGSHEGYVKWVCAAALARGWRAAVLNYRGCNGLPFTSPRGYAATMSHDVFTAVYSAKARYPSAPLVAVGYSLGGLKLTKYLAEADAGLHPPPPGQPHLFSGSGLAAAAVVSSPVSLALSAAKLSDPTSVGFLYNLAVAYKLREHISHHRRDIEAHTRFDVEAALSQWTVGGIEDHGLPASLGFTDRHQYYAEASSPDYIPAITTPTLILLAEDDPFLGIVPDVECSRNPSTLLALTRRGGHVAFLQGAWPLGKSYMDDAVMEFFAATLEHLHGHPLPQQHQQHSQQQQGKAAQQQAQKEGGGADAAAEAAAAGPEAVAAAAAAAATRQGPASGGRQLRGGGARGTEGTAAWVTDAAREGARAAAAAAVGAGRPCAERCCGGSLRQCLDGAAAEAVPPPPRPEAAPVSRSGGAAGGSGGRTGGVAGGASLHSQAAASSLAAAAAGGASAAHSAAARTRAVGDRAGQLRLMVQLQQQLERQRRESAAMAAAAAGAVTTTRGTNGPAAPRSKL